MSDHLCRTSDALVRGVPSSSEPTLPHSQLPLNYLKYQHTSVSPSIQIKKTNHNDKTSNNHNNIKPIGDSYVLYSTLQCIMTSDEPTCPGFGLSRI